MSPVAPTLHAQAVSFDLGQTLLELDESLLLEQAQHHGYRIAASRVGLEQDHAWGAYNRAKSDGLVGFDAWSAFMRDLLLRVEFCTDNDRKPADPARLEAFVRFLWSEQPHNNLWRKPVPGMLELMEALSARGIRIGVLTNSEGRAKELIDTTGFGPFIDTVVDSGVEGIEKPDPRMFSRIAERLDRAARDIVHIGDSYQADVLGALGAGMTPVWFVRETTVTLPPGVLWCRNAVELRTLLLPSTSSGSPGLR
ncbi:MAG TPA: HAD-IA family hydrolase [Polyangiaceae bacterium]